MKEGVDVVCIAKNSAVLEGLLCVFHAERSTGNGLLNTQNELPLLSDWDKQCIAVGGGLGDWSGRPHGQVQRVNMQRCFASTYRACIL